MAYEEIEVGRRAVRIGNTTLQRSADGDLLVTSPMGFGNGTDTRKIHKKNGFGMNNWHTNAAGELIETIYTVK